MTRAESFMKRGKCSENHCSPKPNSAWTDLNSQGKILKLHDKCTKPKCNCQKNITFTPHQYMLERGSIKSKLQKTFRGRKKAWDNFIKPGLKMATPHIDSHPTAKLYVDNAIDEISVVRNNKDNDFGKYNFTNINFITLNKPAENDNEVITKAYVDQFHQENERSRRDLGIDFYDESSDSVKKIKIIFLMIIN